MFSEVPILLRLGRGHSVQEWIISGSDITRRLALHEHSRGAGRDRTCASTGRPRLACVSTYFGCEGRAVGVDANPALERNSLRLLRDPEWVIFGLVGRDFRYPSNRKRCESFQTADGITRALLATGFEEIEIFEHSPLAVTARKGPFSSGGAMRNDIIKTRRL